MSEQSASTRILFALAGNSRNGLRLTQIAQAISATPSTTLRTLQRLAEDGLVEPAPHLEKHWRLSARIVQIALAHQAEVDREQQSLHEFKHNYSRLPS